MASSKINPKAKSKDEKGKIGCKVSTLGEDNEDLDLALLRKPIQTSVTGFAQARKIFDLATEELKDLLSNECDVLYECKVCRNLFRSLANFISHKRVYCKDKFNTSAHGYFIEPTSMSHELQQIKNLEDGYQESLQCNFKEKADDDDDEDRIPLTKDLTTIFEKIARNSEVTVNNSKSQQVVLRKIPSSSVAVFQNVNYGDKNQDNMQEEVVELSEILSRDKAILQKDGTFKIQSSETIPQLPENVIQISDDDDGDEHPKCKICGQKFATMKTLKFHMKYKHLESRLVYPCPDCLEIFSTSWSVYRHLFKVHRKSAAQIRRLRESIQAKAFKLNNPPAFYEKRKNSKPVAAQKITEEERLEQENQEWMDNMEGDNEIPRCGGCGRTFERRAALAAHTNTCQPRSRALARRQETKKIEIQIRKDYNKTIKVNDKPNEEPKNKDDDTENVLEEAVMDIDFHNKGAKEITSNGEPTDYTLDDVIPSIKLPFAQQSEKSNMVALKQKMAKDIVLGNLECKICKSKSANVQKLFDHMADHYKWMRYACKLCNFKHYTYERLPQHVKEVHKLKGDSDFYFSTVKALDGGEALEMAEVSEELNDEINASPDSKRPSRYSSDSSRLSDDSSSSCARVDIGNRKRKIMSQKQNTNKKKKENDNCKDDNLDMLDGDSNISNKLDENSSDMEDIEDKLAKRMEEKKTVTTRRPVRNKTKRKNEDFEYDLSNLLKKDAQGTNSMYSYSGNPKTSQNKKEKKEKEKPETIVDYLKILKGCSGALAMLSRKTILKGKAHLKASYSATRERTSVFARPMVPKILARGDKASPKKDTAEEINPIIQSVKETLQPEAPLAKEIGTQVNNVEKEVTNKCLEVTSASISSARNRLKSQLNNAKTEKKIGDSNQIDNVDTTQKITVTSEKKPNSALPAIVMKNPLINKNINDLKKAGMKTKILVIKPINRNKDPSLTSNMKFQTIKLNKSLQGSANEKVVVVQVPNVDCNVNSEKSLLIKTQLPNVETCPSNGDIECDKELSTDAQKPKEPIADDSTLGQVEKNIPDKDVENVESEVNEENIVTETGEGKEDSGVIDSTKSNLSSGSAEITGEIVSTKSNLSSGSPELTGVIDSTKSNLSSGSAELIEAPV